MNDHQFTYNTKLKKKKKKKKVNPKPLDCICKARGACMKRQPYY